MPAKGVRTFSEVFGNTLGTFAAEDDRICAVTAAMKSGTGLSVFADQYPERFFDTGIAEEHAVTFCGAMAANGMRPVFAVYSTFLQRSYDQLLHDAALQRVHVTLAIDRAGIVGDDGETHQGVFDTAFLRTVPGAQVFAPCYFAELEHMLHTAVYDCDGVAAVRYPRGTEGFCPADYAASDEPWQLLGDAQAEIVLVTYGRLFSYACLAREALTAQGISVSVIKLNRIIPIPADAVEAAAHARHVFFFEEGIRQGGVGEDFAAQLAEHAFRGSCRLFAIDDTFVPHASVAESLHALSLDAEGMQVRILEALKK